MYIEGGKIYLSPGVPMGPEHLGSEATEEDLTRFTAKVLDRIANDETEPEDDRNRVEEAVEYVWNDGTFWTEEG